MQRNKVVEWVEQGSVVIPKMLIKSYKNLGLTEEEFVLILQLHQFLDEHIYFPTPKEFCEVMTISPQRCMDIINSLLKKGFIRIETSRDERNRLTESYSLHPLWEKMIEWFFKEEMFKQEEEKKAQSDNEFGQLYQMFESEFGRALSPFEVQTIQSWIDDDKHSYDVIKVALKEAVLLGKLNFKYIDRILYEWKRNGIKDVKKATEKAEQYRQNQWSQKQPSVQPKKETTNNSYQNYNWLDSE